MDKNFKPSTRKSDIVVQKTGEEVLIYDLKADKAFCLNETSALVWQACDGKKTIAEVSDFVGKQLNSKVNDEIIWLALDQLGKQNLIEEKFNLADQFDNVSRREVIKKIGTTSLIALPAILALNAPIAAQTASACLPTTGRPVGCTCSGNTNCASNCCRGTTCVANPPCN